MLLVLRNIFSLSHSRQKSTARFLSLFTPAPLFTPLVIHERQASIDFVFLFNIFILGFYFLSNRLSLFDIVLFLSRSFLFLLRLLRRISSMVFGRESRRSFAGKCLLRLTDCTGIFLPDRDVSIWTYPTISKCATRCVGCQLKCAISTDFTLAHTTR